VLTLSSHLDLGLSIFLLPLVFAYRRRLGICSSSTRCIWLADCSLAFLIAVVGFGSLYSALYNQSYICCSRSHRPVLDHKLLAVLPSETRPTLVRLIGECFRDTCVMYKMCLIVNLLIGITILEFFQWVLFYILWVGKMINFLHFSKGMLTLKWTCLWLQCLISLEHFSWNEIGAWRYIKL
jgi:hypothetical protein